MTQLTTIDKFGMYVGGGLVVLGVVVIGLVEMLIGAPHPVTGDGQIVHEALIAVEIRSYIIILGLLAWGITAIYKVLTPDTQEHRTSDTQEHPTD